MKKLFTLLMLMVCAVGTMLGQEEITVGRTLEFSKTADYVIMSNENANTVIEDGTGKTGTSKDVCYKGTKVSISAKCYRDTDKDGKHVIAFNENVYTGFKTEITEGYKINLSKITAKVATGANFSYQIILYDENNNKLYTSNEYTITNYSKSSATNTDAIIEENITLTGTVHVRMYYWNTGDSGSKYIVPLELSLTGTIEENSATPNNQDATLKSISYNGTPISNFNKATLSYDVELPIGTTDVPTVTAEATSSTATVTITQATGLPGSATIKVVAEDNTTVKEYAVNFTVSKGSSEKELKQAMFSNGFDGFIKGNTIEAYYMEGTDVPTLEATVSDKATYNVEGETLTITAEDGTTAEYTIKLSPVSPYTGLGRVFDGTESGWIKTGYAFDANKGWRFSKNVEEDANKRISEGKNRLYFFIDACNSITLKTATGSTSNRNIKVYVDGKEDASITTLPKYADGAKITINGNPTAPCIVAIVSNQTGGDGGFGEVIVEKNNPASITLNSYGYSTYSNENTVTIEGAVAYTCQINTEKNKAILKEIGNVIPAGQGVLLKGEASATVTITYGGEEPVIDANDFKPSLKEVATPTDKTIYTLSGNQFKKYVGTKLVANKAYIAFDNATEAMALSIEFEGGTTDINGIETSSSDNDAPVYNLNGQRVSKDAKGILIKNGKKFINK